MGTGRIMDLMNRLERVKQARENEPEPDGLSLSLWKFGEELASLDEAGLAAVAEAMDVSTDAVRQMALTYAR